MVENYIKLMDQYTLNKLLDFAQSNYRDLPDPLGLCAGGESSSGSGNRETEETGRKSKRQRCSAGEAEYDVVSNSLIRLIRKKSAAKKEWFILAKDLQEYIKQKEGPESAKCLVSPQLLAFYNAHFKEDVQLGCSAYRVGQWMVKYITEKLPPNYFQELLKRLK
ncbi:hypothetical protein HDU98_006340 [Podochytrium sp. JEL0797]|nr:hypothetical protein HDU98_006340 [Podochytrium sp. JEL0797]